MNNTIGGSNTAVGDNALTANTTGVNNVAFGTLPLSHNTTGSSNTAIGNLALEFSEDTNDHVCVGRQAGSGITTANNNIIIGHLSGVHSIFGQVSDRCFIGNIYGAPVSSATATAVMIDSDGRLGTFTVAAADPGGLSPQRVQPQAIPDAAKQTMLNRKVEKQQATIAELKSTIAQQQKQIEKQQKQMETVVARLKEQESKIQKVSAQLELNKPAPQLVASDQ